MQTGEKVQDELNGKMKIETTELYGQNRVPLNLCILKNKYSTTWHGHGVRQPAKKMYLIENEMEKIYFQMYIFKFYG